MGSSTLGAFVSQRRKKLGLRQQELADDLGYTVQAISRFENGQFQLDLSTLPVLAKTLHLSLDDLIKEKDEEADVPCQVDFNPRILQGNLAYLRNKSNLTQKQVAKIASVSPRSIANYEKGISQPSLDCVLSYLSHFEVRADDLFGIYLAPEAAASTAKKKKRPILLIPLVLFIVLVSGGGGYGLYVVFKNAKAPTTHSSTDSVSSGQSSSNDASSISDGNYSSSTVSSSEQSFSNPLPEGPIYVNGAPASLQRGRCYFLQQKETDTSYPLKFSALRYNDMGTIIQGSGEMSTLNDPWHGFYVPFSPSLCANNLAFFICDYSTSAPSSQVFSLPVENTSGAGFTGQNALHSLENNYLGCRESTNNGLSASQQTLDEATAEGKSKGYLDKDGNETASCPDAFKKEWEADSLAVQKAKKGIESWTFLIKLIEDDVTYLATLS